MIREIFAMAETGLCLPSIVFFEPNTAFLDWMGKRYNKDIIIYDVGAGNGHVSAELNSLGHNAKAIDLHYRDEGLEVEIANGVLYRYERDAIVMLCRPCHGLFVEVVIDRAKECGVREVLYVGLERNVENDLGDYLDNAEEIAGPFGEDGERIWIIR